MVSEQIFIASALEIPTNFEIGSLFCSSAPVSISFIIPTKFFAIFIDSVGLLAVVLGMLFEIPTHLIMIYEAHCVQGLNLF